MPVDLQWPDLKVDHQNTFYCSLSRIRRNR